VTVDHRNRMISIYR